MFPYYPRPFGRYWLLKRLAEGGMGALHVAATGPPGLEKLCVIKTLLPGRDDQEFIARFNGEAQVLVRLAHGNLVPVLDVGHHEGQLYLAMEYVAGKDLRAVWNRCHQRRVAVPIDVALHVVRELLRGLHYAHTLPGLRLVHRDVSPQNVLLSYAGEVKLADFGLAKSTLSQVETEFGVVYGKPEYMSPEQSRGEPLDARSDVYAAGIVLWELLTGQQLFPPPPHGAHPAARPFEQVPLPSDVCARVPRDLDGIVMMALQPRPADRYADAETMRGALASYLSQEAPTMDASRVARFVEDLFSADQARERAEDERLLEGLRAHREQKAAPAPPRAALGPGALVDGRYRLDRIIGRGGMGEVWAAEHVEIGLPVAVKLLTAVHARGPGAVAAFQHEARATSAIGHPNLVSVTDAGRHGDTFYLVMELLRGRTLQDELAMRGRLPPALALHVAQQVAEALAAAHDRGIVHRDLKPANVFLLPRPAEGADEAGDALGAAPGVKVLDFGIALQLTQEEVAELHSSGRVRATPGGVLAGTLAYMAPEQVQGRPCDGRVDVYALGVVLHHMLTGELPASDEGAPLDHPFLPPPLVPLLRRALARNPDDRFPGMREFTQDIGRAQRELLPAPIVEPAETGRVRMPPRPPLRPPVGLLGALLGVVLGLAGWLLWPRQAPLPQPPGLASMSMVPDLATTAPDLPPPADLAPRSSGGAPDLARPPRPDAGAAHSHTPRTCALDEALAQLRVCRNEIERGQLQVAQVACQAAQCNPRTRCRAQAGLAEMALLGGDVRRAIQVGEQAVRCPGGGLDAHLVLGDAYLKAGRHAEAREQYGKVLMIDPENRAAREGISRAGAP